MFSGFQNFERRDANGNGGVVGSDASSRTSNASEVFTDDAVVNPRRLLAVQCGRVPREGASPMAPKRCWFSPTAVVPPRPHQSLDSFFKTRRFITPPTANTSVLRHHSRCASCSDFRSRHHQEKFSLGTNHLTRWQLPFKQPDGALHNARPSTRCGGSSAVKSGSIHEHVGGGEGRGSSGRRRRRGREEEARFGRRGRRSRGRGSARDGEGESGHVGV